MNPVSKIRADHARDRCIASVKLAEEERSARVELCMTARKAGRRFDAAVNAAWDAYHASPLPRREARAAALAVVDAAEKEYAVVEAEALRVCAARIDPAHAEYEVTMTELAAARDRALEVLAE